METEFLIWMGFGLSFIAAFVFSLFHICLWSFSKISIGRFLEDREKKYRLKILELYEDLKVSVEIIRFFLIIAFLVFLFLVLPHIKDWPLWMFLLSISVYYIFFDFFPRLINAFNRKAVLNFFLISYTIPFLLSKPLLSITKIKSPEKEPEEQRETTEEEIQAFIEEAKEEGIIETEEGVLIKSVVEFGDTTVREIMTPRVSMICIHKDTNIENLRKLVIQEKHSRIPIYKDRIDNIKGIINAKDLLEYSDDHHKKNPIENLIRSVYFIPESMKVSELLKEFQKRKQKLAIVVDEHGGVSGLVTMEDLMEEIVGEIQDEYDKDIARFIEKGPYDYIVSGDAEVEELEKLFELDLADDEYITVGGLITHHLGRLPEPEEEIEIKSIVLKILEVDQKRIKKLRVKKISPSE